MSKTKKSTIEVKGIAVTVLSQASDDYISVTDIAKHKEPDRSDHVIQNWMRNRNTIEFLGVWERLNNADFRPLEFEGMNAELIHMALPQGERLKRLNEIAIRQMQVLTGAMAIKQLKG